MGYLAIFFKLLGLITDLINGLKKEYYLRAGRQEQSDAQDKADEATISKAKHIDDQPVTDDELQSSEWNRDNQTPSK